MERERSSIDDAMTSLLARCEVETRTSTCEIVEAVRGQYAVDCGVAAGPTTNDQRPPPNPLQQLPGLRIPGSLPSIAPTF